MKSKRMLKFLVTLILVAGVSTSNALVFAKKEKKQEVFKIASKYGVLEENSSSEDEEEDENSSSEGEEEDENSQKENPNKIIFEQDEKIDEELLNKKEDIFKEDKKIEINKIPSKCELKLKAKPGNGKLFEYRFRSVRVKKNGKDISKKMLVSKSGAYGEDIRIQNQPYHMIKNSIYKG